MTLGKRGHITRLSVDHEEFARFLESGAATSSRNGGEALLVVLDEDSFVRDDKEECRIKPKVLMEIGAALVLFKNRVILIGDKQFPPPEDIHDLIYYHFEKNTLPWEVGIELINIIERFKNEVRQSIV